MYVAQQDPGKNLLQNSETPNSPQVNWIFWVCVVREGVIFDISRWVASYSSFFIVVCWCWLVAAICQVCWRPSLWQSWSSRWQAQKKTGSASWLWIELALFTNHHWVHGRTESCVLLGCEENHFGLSVWGCWWRGALPFPWIADLSRERKTSPTTSVSVFCF